MRKILGVYKNGNYHVAMFSDGTKIRANKLDNLTPAFPESIDMKICNRCDRGCKMCHECSTPDGALADLNAPFLDTLKPYTELAIGGGNPLEHPGLVEFLKRMKAQKVICNMTVHLDHFQEHYGVIKSLVNDGLIHGLGISVHRALDLSEISEIQEFPNAVVHVVAGIATPLVFQCMRKSGLKLLILGYKTFGRGELFRENHKQEILDNIVWLKNELPNMTEYFPVISFDNLAIKQLQVENIVTEQQWETAYMGDDGQYTMYIDLVKNEYAVSSTSERHPIVHDNIEDMFQSVRKMSGHK